MSKQLTFTYKDKDYTLEFTRKAVEKLEQSGFNVGELENKPLIMLPKLFHGAFYSKHPEVNAHVADNIYECITNKEELLAKLAEMYAEPILALMEEPTDEKKVKWMASF